MLIKWKGGSRQSGFPTTSTTKAALRTTAILVNILSVICLSLAVPSSVPPPTVLLAKSIGIPVASPTQSMVAVPSSIHYGSPSGGRRVPKQVGLPVGSTTASNTDHESSGTHHHHNHGFMGDHGGHHHHHGHHHGDGKYFMYAHNPGYDEYEYGYRRGNDYHFQERYEKYGPAWNFKTKVKWGDKYGGYGEHYWDYNHAGSGHDDGGHGHGHYSEPVPTYENQPGASNGDQRKVAMIYKRQSSGGDSSSTSSSKKSTKDKYKHTESKRIPVVKQKQRQEEEVLGDSKTAEGRNGPVLMLDRKTGQVIDAETGRAYWLRPENSKY